ncbi:RpiB/LacA/LacB family sugar-phosphate isomerase [Candidatus Amesbacteria bacterium]|nr:RpiB/LacA/LacB family sugar-phosphate isomerase [Candidatus Amesbacteria bacterium]
MIYLGADHRGYDLKAKIAKWLVAREYEFEDMGPFAYDHDDDFTESTFLVAEQVSQSPDKNRGIVICGSGVGVSIAANKLPRVRCGLGFAEDQVHASRKDDNINILAIASDNTDEEHALKLVEKFLETPFIESERYLRRIEKISRFEKIV